MTPGERVARANRVKEILEESVMREAFEGVRSVIVAKLENEEYDLGLEREMDLIRVLKNLKLLRLSLVSVIQDGDLALAEQKEEEHQQSWLQRLARKA
jgi:hypothetical protein